MRARQGRLHPTCVNRKQAVAQIPERPLATHRQGIAKLISSMKNHSHTSGSKRSWVARHQEPKYAALKRFRRRETCHDPFSVITRSVSMSRIVYTFGSQR